MLGALLIVVVLVIGLGVGAVGAAVVARHRAQSGADLAALAAAGAVPVGAGACERAGALAAATRMRLGDCRVDGLDAVVTVVVPVRFGRWDLGSARAAARAGPVESEP